MRVNPGLYRVWWASGGSSLAAVGCTATGDRWIAPTDWVSAAVIGKMRTDWADVIRFERIDPPEVGSIDPRQWLEHIRRALRLLETVLAANEKFVVRLETVGTHSVYLAEWPGDPGRTHSLADARRYASERGAKIALGIARRYHPFRDAEIIQVEP